MGKSDDLQRQRAEQHARLERDAKRREDEAKRAPPPPPPPAEVVAAPAEVAESAPIALVKVSLDVAVATPVNEQRAVAKKAGNGPVARAGKKAGAAAPKAGVAAGEETGRCSSCGKQKALNRGLVIDHQKGLGKACSGSRKRPV